MKYSKYTNYLVSLETVASGKAVGTMKNSFLSVCLYNSTGIMLSLILK